jgi:threonine synthase
MKTPQKSYKELSDVINIPEIYLKREDLHPLGSHKGRSIPYMIQFYAKEYKIVNFCISSSGNAAFAAASYISEHNKNNPKKQLSVTIFVGKHIDLRKLSRIKAVGNTNIITVMTERPKQQAFLFEQSGHGKNLRQSTDKVALIGYHELAKELGKIPELEAIFIPTSSGTAAQGIAEKIQKINKQIQIHIVQTTKCHPLAEVFDKTFEKTESSCASAIVDIIGKRKENLVKEIKKSFGYGWVVSDEQIIEAQKLVKEKTDIDISTNSALSIAGVKKAVESGWVFDGSVVCLITGV